MPVSLGAIVASSLVFLELVSFGEFSALLRIPGSAQSLHLQRFARDDGPAKELLASFRGPAVVSLALGLSLAPLSVYGQADSTGAAPPDTLRQPPADTTQPPADTARRPPANGTQRPTEQPLRPLDFSAPVYGRPRTDSLPARLPHVSVERILAEQAGGFLYDLGEYGWPNGWSLRGLPPHRVHLWTDGLPFDDPLTGRARFELLPPSFLTPPRTGVSPGGGAIGVHTAWRSYAPKRPVTEIRYRFDNSGLHAVEVGHSQKRRLDLYGRPGVLHVTLGYSGRKADGVYDGSALRRERRIWARLRYQTNDWTVELNDRSSIYRVRAHGGATPRTSVFESIYLLPLAEASVRSPKARRKTVRNDLSARVRAPLLPGLDRRTEGSLRWTSHTLDFRDPRRDTTWTTKLNGGHFRLQQSLQTGRHHLTGTLQGSLWGLAQSNVPQLQGTRWAVHLGLRDSLRLGRTGLRLDAGGHLTSDQVYPSFHARLRHPTGPLRLTAGATVTGQRSAWIETAGFASLVDPLRARRGGLADHLVEGRVGIRANLGTVDLRARGFAHRIQHAVDLYAGARNRPPPTTYTDTITARATASPVRRAGITLGAGWRRNARRGLYATGRGTLLKMLNARASSLHQRLARTLPRAYGRVRLGARFVVFTDLITELYVEARGWTGMNSRWFHPPTGRLVVPPAKNPIPVDDAPDEVGPSGTVDVRAEAQLRGATLFFTFQNVQAGTQLQPGTLVVPTYPLPPQQFRFGVFWPIFD